MLKNNLALEFDALGGILEQDYKYQWTLQDTNNNRFTMLNTDIEIAYDIDVDNFGEGTTCEVVVGYMEDDVNTACICPTIPDSNYCPASDAFELVQTYANVSIPFSNYDINLLIDTDCMILNLPSRTNYLLNLLFIQDEEAFLADFKMAYELMMEKGSFTLAEPV